MVSSVFAGWSAWMSCSKYLTPRPPPDPPNPPPPLTVISLMVSVDVKHQERKNLILWWLYRGVPLYSCVMCRAADEVTLLLEPSYSVTCLLTRRYADGANCFKNTTVAGKLEFLVKTCKCFLYRFFLNFQSLFFALSLPAPSPPSPPPHPRPPFYSVSH